MKHFTPTSPCPDIQYPVDGPYIHRYAARMIMKQFKLMFVGLILAVTVHADVGSGPPSAAELAKAPPWPKKYSGNPRNCKKLDESSVLNTYHADSRKRGPEHPITIEQIDLNVDGICEILVLDTKECGNKWCAPRGYLLHGKEWRELGDVPHGEFLEPHKGWIQIGALSQGGPEYYRALFRYSDVATPGSAAVYHVYRRDIFQPATENGVWKTRYVRTIYEK